MDREAAAELVRVGDDERERVVTALHEHAARGRLEPEELDDVADARLGRQAPHRLGRRR